MSHSITLKDVYSITEKENAPNDKGYWTKIGIGFVNRDNSINIVLDALPVNGRLHIRDRQPKRTTKQEGVAA